jgi:hypothetical protein
MQGGDTDFGKDLSRGTLLWRDGGYMLPLLVILSAVLLQAPDAAAEPHPFEDRVGDIYELRLESTSETTGDRSSSSSRSVNTLQERVVALRDDGVELEFDLPADATQEDRSRSWQFPARVLKSVGLPLQLLNGPELETRGRAWLAGAGLTEAACGRWVFTWTAIKIECDPQSVLQILEAFDLRLNDLLESKATCEWIGATPMAPHLWGSSRSIPTQYAENEPRWMSLLQR